MIKLVFHACIGLATAAALMLSIKPTTPDTDEPAQAQVRQLNYEDTLEALRAEYTAQPEELTAETTTEAYIAVTATEPETTTYTAVMPECAEYTGEADSYKWQDEVMLASIATAEAGGQGVEGMALVIRVVLNRCAISGASIEAVITQPGQFAAVSTDTWINKQWTAEAMQAVQLVESGWDLSQGATYFCSLSHNSWHRSALTYLFTYGGHEFYK